MKGISMILQHLISKTRSWPGGKRRVLPFSGFLVMLLLIHTHCKKSSPPPNILPPVTQEGKNTFGCRVNGEVWIPYFSCTVRTGTCKELGFGVYHNDTISKLPIYFTLTVRRTIGDTLYSSFDMYTDGTRITNTGNVIDSVFLIYTKGTKHFTNFPPNRRSGFLNLSKLDTVNHIMAGAFSFRLYDTGGDSVLVTDGRFDLTYNACLCH
jgi:hypothetical protein